METEKIDNKRAWMNVGEPPRIPIPEVGDIWSRKENSGFFLAITEVAPNILDLPVSAFSIKVRYYYENGLQRNGSASASWLEQCGFSLLIAGDNAKAWLDDWVSTHPLIVDVADFTIKQADALLTRKAIGVPQALVGIVAMLIRKGTLTTADVDAMVDDVAANQ